ncbi:acylneuraminate cytidylyltransferase family protein [Roseivirga pacifica]|uniref:acylneuraminate cytidylyltransferase family protein n=1 Tax=Roseivirga pacifica TaxID=1267423 RepID=UPI003BAA2DDA
MINGKKVLAVVTARGGSKGLPGKNIKEFNGKPLIAWTIEQGLNCQSVDRLIVSTDDVEIAHTSREHGAEVPFLRPDYLAGDTATSIDVIVHAIDFLEQQGDTYDIVILLEPTSPLRESSDIDYALKRLVETPAAQSIAGVSEVEGQHPDFLVRIENEFMRPYLEFDVKRRQDLKSLYFFEGSVYAAYIPFLLRERSFYTHETLAYEVPKWKSFEIDDIVDFYLVEHLFIQHQKGNI